jgi:hypothetical protein
MWSFALLESGTPTRQPKPKALTPLKVIGLLAPNGGVGGVHLSERLAVVRLRNLIQVDFCHDGLVGISKPNCNNRASISTGI